MLPITADELRRFRAEVELGLDYRDKPFGTYRQQRAGSKPTTTLAGCNLDLFEQGARTDAVAVAPLNLVFPVSKNIVPTLFFQNPHVTAQPEDQSPEGADDSFYASRVLMRDLEDPFLRIEETCQSTVFDGYVLGYGVIKVGYATEFGPDVLPTKQEDRKRLRDKLKEQVSNAMVAVGLKQPSTEPEDPETVQTPDQIRSESPYFLRINCFDFVVDPRASDLSDARWVAQLIRRTLGEVKRDRRYARAKHELLADAIDDDRVPESFIEDFQTVDVWEVHYKDADSPTGITVLTFAATQDQTKALMHEHNAYDIGGWQFEWLTLNKHGHQLYPISTISICRPLLDRINSSLDAVLEQVDKFVAKIGVNERITKDGQEALLDGVIGNVVKFEGRDDIRGAIQLITMDQVKAELLGLINQVIDFVILQTGLTRAQLTGLSTANTATEAQIGQGGQNVRRGDEAKQVAAWFTRALTKYWRVKAQYQDLTEISLPKEANLLSADTGISQTQWYPPIDDARAARLRESRFRFKLDVFSMQKPNLEVLRAQFEQFMRGLMEPVVSNGLALDGYRISAVEAIRQWSRFFQEAGLPGLERMLVPVDDPALKQALMTFGQPKPTGKAQLNGQLNGTVPTRADLISQSAGEKGQGIMTT